MRDSEKVKVDFKDVRHFDQGLSELLEEQPMTYLPLVGKKLMN